MATDSPQSKEVPAITANATLIMMSLCCCRMRQSYLVLGCVMNNSQSARNRTAASVRQSTAANETLVHNTPASLQPASCKEAWSSCGGTKATTDTIGDKTQANQPYQVRERNNQLTRRHTQQREEVGKPTDTMMVSSTPRPARIRSVRQPQQWKKMKANK